MYTEPIPLLGSTFDEWESWVLEQTLEFFSWNITEAAKNLQIGRATLHRLINKYNLRKK